MSHVAQVDLEIRDLDALKKACKALELEFVENSTSYRWYGHSVGDYALPKGFSASDLGKCEHEIRVKNNASAYSIGVAKRRDGKKGYTLLYDHWNNGYGLMPKVGSECGKLLQGYSTEVAVKQLRKQGYRTKLVKNEDGTLQIRARR